MGWFDKLFQKRSYSPFMSFMPFNQAAEPITGDTALQCPPYVSAINLMSTSLAKLSRHVVKSGERVQHPVEKLLDKPNPFIDGYTFFQQAELQRLNEGNAYIHITRNEKGIGKALMLVSSSFVTQKIEGGAFYYEVQQGEQRIRVEPKDMIHVKSPFMDINNLKGIGFHTVLKEQIGLWLAAQKHQARYFSLGSDPTSLLTTDEKLSEEKRSLVREAWERLNSNDNRHRVAVLDAGFKFQKLGTAFSELEMNQMYSELTKQIASAFNIAPSMIGHDGSKNTYTNVESQNMQFLQQALLPNITAWEYQLNKLFGENSGYTVKFNYETLLRADSASRAERLTKLVAANIITRNEAREHEGLPPVEGGEVIGDHEEMRSNGMQSTNTEKSATTILQTAQDRTKQAI